MEEETETKTPPQIEQINFIYDSIRAGTAEKGGFEMADIKLLRDSRDKLIILFTETNEVTSKIEDFEAFDALLKGVKILQLTGVFQFDRSYELFNITNSLKAALEERKDPLLKIAAMRKDMAELRNSTTQKDTTSNNRGRGRGHNKK